MPSYPCSFYKLESHRHDGISYDPLESFPRKDRDEMMNVCVVVTDDVCDNKKLDNGYLLVHVRDCSIDSNCASVNCFGDEQQFVGVERQLRTFVSPQVLLTIRKPQTTNDGTFRSIIFNDKEPTLHKGDILCILAKVRRKRKIDIH